MTNKGKWVFSILFMSVPILAVHLFFFSIFMFRNALEIPVFIVFPLVMLCLDSLTKYMPMFPRHIINIEPPRNQTEPTIALGIFELVLWYGILALAYWNLPLQTLNEIEENPWILGGGYASLFVLNAIAAFILAYMLKVMRLLRHSIPTAFLPILTQKLVGVLTFYVIFALIFSAIYRLLQVYLINPFNQPLESTIDSVYFSFVTITTLGYGDFYPLHWCARLFVILEVLIGVVFMAVMIGLVISTSLEAAKKTANKQFKSDS